MKNEKQVLHLELTIDEVNLIINALGQLPYVQVVATMESLGRQVAGQLATKPTTQANGNLK